MGQHPNGLFRRCGNGMLLQGCSVGDWLVVRFPLSDTKNCFGRISELVLCLHPLRIRYFGRQVMPAIR